MGEATDQIAPPAAGQWRESPIINNPYRMPELHLKLSGKKSEDSQYEVAAGRRAPGLVHENSEGNPASDTSCEPYGMIGRIRGYVNDWREGGFQGVDANTARLLHHWTEVKDGKGLFFCQREAIETLIWLHTFKGKDSNCDGIHREIDRYNETLNDGLPRLSTKMATGTGKTVVMAMLMLWMALRSRDPVHNFLIITPGITVTERLKELTRTNGPDVFEEHELLPGDMHRPPMSISIKHRHLLEPKQGKGTEIGGKPPDKASLGMLNTYANELAKKRNAKVESDDENFQQVMNRLCGPLPAGTPIAVLNDEAHHCYSVADDDDRKWYYAVTRIRNETKCNLIAVHDFSATPIWISKKPDTAKGDVFPWTVSDFPLIEAVESGLTKIPRIPTYADSEGQQQARRVFEVVGDNRLKNRVNSEVEEYLSMLVNHHLTETQDLYSSTGDSPIICVVANTIANAQAFFRTIAGHWDDDPSKRENGVWEELSNLEMGKDGTLQVKEHPPTLLVHSEVDKGKGAEMGETGAIDSPDLLAFFGKGANDKRKYKKLAENVRKKFGTAGRIGEDGEHVRCIVSVSMLTEGWDCRTVTEIFGFRAFRSDLLIEQVTGRALRRTNYELEDETGLFAPQHANLIGVPYSWVPDAPKSKKGTEQVEPYKCRVLEGREAFEIRMPRVERYEAVPKFIRRTLNPDGVKPHNLQVHGPADAIEVSFEGGQPTLINSVERGMSRDKAVWTIAAVATTMLIEETKHQSEGARVDESDQHGSDSEFLRERLPVMRDMLIAANEWWMHSDSRAIVDGIERVVSHDPAAEKCAEALLASCAKTECGGWLRAHLSSNQEWASSAVPECFMRRLKHRYPFMRKGDNEVVTDRSQRNVAPCHSATEAWLASILDNSELVDAWVRNEGLGFFIPYRGANGYSQKFEPDFVVRSKNGNLLVVEYKGEWQGKSDIHENSKKHYSENYWVPSVNRVMAQSGNDAQWGFLWLDTTSNLPGDIERALVRLDGEAYVGRSGEEE